MATVPTGLANSLDAAGTRAKLDTAAKKLVKHRVILAEILKECTDEFKDFDLKYIQDNCFVGEVKMDIVSVDQDIPDADETDTSDADTSVVGSDTEDASIKEGTIRYDLIFDAVVPDTQKQIRMVINVEIQVSTDLPYSIVTRAIYYAARLVSRQKGTVFTNSDYQKIQKVYSIWICPDPKKMNANSIAEYGITQQKVIGRVKEKVENYDKIKIIILSVNDEGMENRNTIIRLLSTLLSTTESVENRKKILQNDFNISMTKEIEEEVAEMCNLGMAVELKGVEKGVAQGIKQGVEIKLIEDIKNLMDTLKLTAEQAMDALKVPKEDQEYYAKKL